MKPKIYHGEIGADSFRPQPLILLCSVSGWIPWGLDAMNHPAKAVQTRRIRFPKKWGVSFCSDLP